MATAVAQKIEFPEQAHRPFQQDGMAPITAATREQALHHMMAGCPAVFDQGVDPQIYRAANGLIERHRAGQFVDIEAYGYPFDVLENVAAQLQSIGASQYVTAQVMGSLQDYIVNMGSEFSRAAKAKPLYARIMVTDSEPDDLPECEQTQATFLDGVRKVGGEAARINVQSTVFGTKSTTSQGVDLNTMFASKTNGLFVFFGSPTNEGIGGFDSVDAALVNLAQGMGGGAGGATQQAIDDIKQAIKNGEATPQTLKLIENLAALSALADGMKTPGAVANAPAKMAEIVRAITQQIQTGVAEGTIPAAVLQATATAIANMQGNDVVQAVLASPEGAKALIVADNDNAAPAAVKADNDNATIAKQIETITAQLTELAAAPNTPPEMRAQIEAQIAQITKAMDAPQGAEMQAVLASVTQTISTMETPAAEAIVAKIDVAAVQIAAAQTVEAPVVAAAAPLPQLPEIAELAAADIKELVAVLQKADALPPALAEAVQKIDLQNMTPEKLAEAVQGKGESAPAVQAMIVALADPAVQAELPGQTLVSVNEFVARQPDVIPTVTTQVAVQTLDTIAAAAGVDTPAGAEITTITQTLKDGTQTIATLPPADAGKVTTVLEGNNPPVATALRSFAEPAPVGGGVPLAPPAALPAQPPVDFKQPDITPTPAPTPVAPPVDIAPLQPAPVQPPTPAPVDVAPVQPAPIQPAPAQPPAPTPVGGPTIMPQPINPAPQPVNPPTNGGPKPVPPPQPVDLKQPPKPAALPQPKPPEQKNPPAPQDKKPDQAPKDKPAENKDKPVEDKPKAREQERQQDPKPAEDPKTKPEEIKYKQPEKIYEGGNPSRPDHAEQVWKEIPTANPIRIDSPSEPIIQIHTNQPEEKVTGSGCDTCGPKNCSTCGTAFKEAVVANENIRKAAALRESGVTGLRFSTLTNG